MEKETKEINTKIEKFETVKEFRDLNSLKLINKDNSTISLNEKFKDFQEIYSLIRTDIEENKKISYVDLRYASGATVGMVDLN